MKSVNDMNDIVCANQCSIGAWGWCFTRKFPPTKPSNQPLVVIFGEEPYIQGSYISYMYIHKHLLAKYLWMLLRRVHSDFGDLEKGCLRWFWQAISETSYPGVEGGLKIDNHHMVWSTYQKSHQNFSTNHRQTVVQYEVIISNECDNCLVFSSRSAFLKSPHRFVPKWRGSNLQSRRCCDCKEHSAKPTANNGNKRR